MINIYSSMPPTHTLCNRSSSTMAQGLILLRVSRRDLWRISTHKRSSHLPTLATTTSISPFQMMITWGLQWLTLPPGTGLRFLLTIFGGARKPRSIKGSEVLVRLWEAEICWRPSLTGTTVRCSGTATRHLGTTPEELSRPANSYSSDLNLIVVQNDNPGDVTRNQAFPRGGGIRSLGPVHLVAQAVEMHYPTLHV